MDYSMFDEMFNVEELQEQLDDINSQKVERLDVPFGDYEVKITKLELGQCPFEGDDYGKPQINVWFKIINHDIYHDQLLFCTKKLFAKNPQYNGLMLKNAIDFIDTLDSGMEVSFGGSFNAFGKQLEEVFNVIKNYEYHLAYYEKENKGYTFKDYEIIKRFEKN